MSSMWVYQRYWTQQDSNAMNEVARKCTGYGLKIQVKKSEGDFLMAYKITDDCICCGACEYECKNDAISEGETIYVIDPEKCTDKWRIYE
jgi:NAD-dependent dihydropyrimidine dehydrogenase PreA subunit